MLKVFEHILQLKQLMKNACEPLCETKLYSFKIRLQNKAVEGLEKSVHLNILSASLIQKYEVHIKK